ncbi:hypothetical protein OXX69_003419 [Metschnikowia pulcherrima]
MKSIQLLFPLGVFSTMVAAAPLATTSGSIMADPSVTDSLDIRDLSGNRDLSKREEVVRLTNEQKQKQIQKDLEEEIDVLRKWILTTFNDLSEIPSYSLYNALSERAGEATTRMFNVEKELDFFRKLLDEMTSGSETTKLSEVVLALSSMETEVASANGLPGGFHEPFSRHVGELKANIAILEEKPDQKCDWA